MTKYSAAATRCLLLLMTGIAVSGIAWAGPFEDANAKYQAGDYKAAAKGYQEIVQSGHGTPAVLFNLGNALLRSGKKAQALLEYERVLKTSPRNRDLRWNIGVVQSTLTDREGEDELSPLERVSRLAGWVSIDETALALLVLAAVLAAAGWLGFIVHGRLAWLGVVQAFCFFLAVVCSVLFFLQWRTDSQPRVLVLDPEVTLRYGPAFSETKAFVLHEGAISKVLDQSGDWWYVSYGKNAGWLPKKSGEVV